jgi:hypothetical protein
MAKSITIIIVVSQRPYNKWEIKLPERNLQFVRMHQILAHTMSFIFLKNRQQLSFANLTKDLMDRGEYVWFLDKVSAKVSDFMRGYYGQSNYYPDWDSFWNGRLLRFLAGLY